ncbi:MAG: sulfatase [Pirellulaceae bacterium]
MLIVLLYATETTAETVEIKHPNIVFLLADDLGWTGLNCFGSDLYETPRLDQLASKSMKFTNAYAACTVCSPTRASIMTGMYPARLRLTDFIAGQDRPFAKLQIPDWTKRLESRHVTIAEALKQAGYRTGHFGKWHLSDKDSDELGTLPTDQGFDVSISKPKGTRGYFLSDDVRSREDTNYLTDWLTDHACDFIADRSANRPFFLYFAYNVPHTPIQGREDLVDYFQAKVDPNATHNNPTYAAMVKSLDLSVGRVLDQIKSSGQADNTVVIFTSDNGGLTQRNGKHDGFTENLPLRRGKGSAYEGGVRVPTIIYWPGLTKAGSVCAEPIITTDYYPTLLELLNINGDATHNQSVDGRSLSPLLGNPSAKLNRNLYWHYPHYHAGGDGPYSAVRSGNYRLIRFYEDDSVRLFDLGNDIGEQTDLSSEQPEKTRQLAADLDQWLASVDAQLPTKNPKFDAERQSIVKKATANDE